jgi:hypothetical protein
MTFKLDALFDSPEKRYLDANDLSVLSQYVSSIPERVSVYRTLRIRKVYHYAGCRRCPATAVRSARSYGRTYVRNGLMVTRYVAMAMLLDDQSFVEERLRGWLPEIVKAYETQALDRQLFQLLEQKLATGADSASAAPSSSPVLDKAQSIMFATRETVSPSMAGVV